MEQILSLSPQEGSNSADTLTADLWPVLNCERIHFCCFKTGFVILCYSSAEKSSKWAEFNVFNYQGSIECSALLGIICFDLINIETILRSLSLGKFKCTSILPTQVLPPTLPLHFSLQFFFPNKSHVFNYFISPIFSPAFFI